MGARPFKSSSRFTAYISYPLELKLGRMIQDISLHNRSEQDFFRFPPRGRCVGVSLEIFKSITSLQFLSDLAET